MIRFFQKSIVFVLILNIIVGFLNNRYKDTNVYKEMNATNKFSNVPYDIEFANLGTSHAQYGFYYDETDLVTFNFSLPAQRLFYDEKILNRYIGHFKEGATVVIPISYISFYLGYDNDNFEEFNKMYYFFLNPVEIKKFKLEDYIKYRVLPILTAEENIKYVFVDEEEVSEKPSHFNYTISIEKMEEEGKATASRHLDFIKEGQKNKEEFIGILDAIVKKCLDNNLKPVITTIPTTTYYSKYFHEDFLKEFYDSIDKVTSKYPEAKYLDYSNDERFINHPELYFDASHMNLTGAKLFTNIILNDVK